MPFTPQTIFPEVQQPDTQTAWFQPMGFNLKVISNCRAVLEAAQTSFGWFGPAQPKEIPDFIFRLFAHDLDEGQIRPPLLRLDGPRLYQTSGREATLVADLAQGLAWGYFSPTTLAKQSYFRWHFLELAFFLMLEAQGLMGVHGAALVKNGRALLLRAQSGGGKTTLAYAGARSRYQALAEDVVWLDNQRQVWWGMPWSFHLLPDAKKLFPELASYQPVLQTNDEMKLEVNLETIRPGSTTSVAQPQAVLFVERTPGQSSRLQVMSITEAKTLWPAARTGLEMKLPHHAGYLEQLLSENPSYRFYFGDDLEQALEVLEPLFE